MNVRDLSFKLNSIFDINKYEHIDKSLNGLQVGNLNAEVNKVAFAVDASFSTLKEAKGNDFLITHHGIFWSKKERIVSNMYDKIKFLIENNLALYSVHLPMDAHSVYSHSKVLSDFLGLKNSFVFGNYGGINLGIIADSVFSFSEILEKIKKQNKHILFSKKFKESVNKVAIVSGSGYSFFKEALCHDVDLFITGDTSHQIYSLAEEFGVNLIFAGHYFTETFGLIKLMEDFKIKEDLEVKFIYKDTNL
ncbi:Nif3-like dinuclear metal center hexameric protein [Borreliella californiensis]|uniref:GTP cyclohydrolase 1 type 2 homolog n=1 Tax=Borreliella californiensis TaxID=373543 RepID=A0A7W9ZLV0_9SPIR|nr:Nif3-like dinuclear metal center hexameric protein [Borreliella californiensis]MBB6212589.1 dinuclear metal center YbgI/SA1388 family protein [Borreliella californiensis]WKC91747.1 Nif3-like dinuclear metal center hexameric protein [Borreliella californiensis]WNY70499.1 Nif3-like dinuclear metal center hexameric protein [Borreliella californiensis]